MVFLAFLRKSKPVLFLMFPAFVFAIVSFFVIPYWFNYIKEVLDFFAVSAIVTGVLLIFISSKNQFVFWLFYCFLALLALIKLNFYHLFGVKISASALYVFFETNRAEASEFLQTYLSVFTVAIFTVLFLPVFFVKRLTGTAFSFFKFNYFGKIVILSAIVFLGLIIKKYFKSQNVFYVVYASYNDYLDTKKLITKNLSRPESNYIKVEKTDTSSKTYVVIIGESTSRKHMQLYGYHRATNPLLSQIKEKLLVFDSIITPDVHTILALDKILTFSTHQEPNKTPNASVVQLANMAGFTTYWISNQRPVGFHESVSTQMANAAKNRYYLTTDDYMDINYDEKVLPVLKNILNENKKNKMIFIHLIGTHGRYKHRFPESFNYFKDDQVNSVVKSNEAIQEINDYDNAIRYGDFIIKNIIDMVEKKDKNSYVLYFSDHGDEVYDTIDYRGHNSYFATPAMHEIPFFVWFSDTYKEKHFQLFNISNITKRRYSLVHFIHSFADLSGIRFNKFDSTKSVFSTGFKVYPRIINKNIDYDKTNNNK